MILPPSELFFLVLFGALIGTVAGGLIVFFLIKTAFNNEPPEPPREPPLHA